MIAVDEKSIETLRREDVERAVLEEAAVRLETRAGNDVYMRAWKRAAKILRAMKP